jgi:FkbM family methyltransferase
MIEMSKLGKKVYSFEPVPLISACVEKTIKAMGIKNVIHKIVGCGSDNGSDFIHTNYHGESSLGGIRDHMFNQKFACEIVKLDDIINEPIKLIKIDVEGSEFEVLAGAIGIIEEYKPIIILETFKTKRNLKLLDEFAEGFDYDYEYISGDNYLLTPI